MEVVAKTGIVWPPEWCLAYLGSCRVQTLYLLAESIIDISSASLTMLDKILFCKETTLLLSDCLAKLWMSH